MKESKTPIKPRSRKSFYKWN